MLTPRSVSGVAQCREGTRHSVGGRQLPPVPAEPNIPKDTGNLGTALHSDLNQCRVISRLCCWERLWGPPLHCFP